MKYFFDTEFWEHRYGTGVSGGIAIEPISIGIVSADGTRRYYAEVMQFDWSRVPREHWLWDNVKPHLDPEKQKPLHVILDDIENFVGDRPEFWAYYADYDWVVLCGLFGRMVDLPEGWPKWCRDLKQFINDYDVSHAELIHEAGVPSQEHHALADAEWNRRAYWAIKDKYLFGSAPKYLTATTRAGSKIHAVPSGGSRVAVCGAKVEEWAFSQRYIVGEGTNCSHCSFQLAKENA